MMNVLGFTFFERRGPAGGTAPCLLHEYFEWQATIRPDHPAVQCNGRVFSYKQLEVLANRIANWLCARQIGPGCTVAICSEKSCELYAALLGVLKAGAAYVPIDPKFPAERIRSIVHDAGVTCNSEIQSRFSSSIATRRRSPDDRADACAQKTPASQLTIRATSSTLLGRPENRKV
jgi:non-ribosomal peptide synthetase component F